MISGAAERSRFPLFSGGGAHVEMHCLRDVYDEAKEGKKFEELPMIDVPGLQRAEGRVRADVSGAEKGKEKSRRTVSSGFLFAVIS